MYIIILFLLFRVLGSKNSENSLRLLWKYLPDFPLASKLHITINMMVKWMVRIADTDAKQFIDRPFHKTLPKSGSQMHRI